MKTREIVERLKAIEEMDENRDGMTIQLVEILRKELESEHIENVAEWKVEPEPRSD